MAKTAIYRLVTLDVWGNEEEGFEVNERSATRQTFELNFEEDENIHAQLTAAGVLVGYTLDDIDIQGDWQRLEISHAESGKPLCDLEFVEMAE